MVQQGKSTVKSERQKKEIHGGLGHGSEFGFYYKCDGRTSIMLFGGLSLPFSFLVIWLNPICPAKCSVTRGNYALTPRWGPSPTPGCCFRTRLPTSSHTAGALDFRLFSRECVHFPPIPVVPVTRRWLLPKGTLRTRPLSSARRGCPGGGCRILPAHRHQRES